jgi:hypothetical protein
MEILDVANEIERRIKALSAGRKQLQPRAERKANAIAEYEKAIAKTLIQLKNGVRFSLDDQPVIDPPVSNMEKIARGICYKEKLALDLAESEYKNAVVGLGTIQAELNGYQSIFRYLDEK